MKFTDQVLISDDPAVLKEFENPQVLGVCWRLPPDLVEKFTRCAADYEKGQKAIQAESSPAKEMLNTRQTMVDFVETNARILTSCFPKPRGIHILQKNDVRISYAEEGKYFDTANFFHRDPNSILIAASFNPCLESTICLSEEFAGAGDRWSNYPDAVERNPIIIPPMSFYCLDVGRLIHRAPLSVPLGKGGRIICQQWIIYEIQ